ncbi:carbamoyltransferase HypF [Anaeroselena agilis]|uniref:Carbamoyltransferase n=1 Tax=Anaeroselena agilis TaxID=3063788 RepID=A0ABU3P4T0_9FIRM|nr:carbamoyltransferase HypF [Selenomonadales bacterium 4137-cl]
MKRLRIEITGIVQGVGFRPFVHNLARRSAIAGWVANDGRGVVIEAEGEQPAVAAFLAALRTEAPPLAVIDAIRTGALTPAGDKEFAILASDPAAARLALISPDVATCADCRAEIADPADRRYRYPFTNCTNCGPRYTIIEDVPYDRVRTTMAAFKMCPACRSEYEDPADRRFHAQPNACPVCGPAYRLLDRDGRPLPGDPLAEARRLVAAGKVAAIKGIGGYHLACNALDAEAVAALRSRKVREDKPFAVMAGSLEAIRARCRVDAAEEELLAGTARPIVLLAKGPGYDLAAAVAPGNPYVGMMLPYAPVHWLLLAPGDVWVMTSGNTSDEPIAFEDDDALARLAGIADFFLAHNRPIRCRADDSVARVFAGRPYILRRSRGFAPAPVRLNAPGPAVLACGGELKNAFCLTRGDLAFMSAHVGDLENMATYNAYTDAIAHYQRLFDVVPEVVAHDLHPEYLATKYAMECGLPRVGVQHHHAHIAAVLAEHGESGPAIGVAFDGTGYGDDGRLWGGEFLLADLKGYTRLAQLAYMPLPGGARAIREPWRLAARMLYELYGADFVNKDIPFTRTLPAGWELMLDAAAKGLNAPLSSGAGRLFDTAAALLGIRGTINYEGQAAVELELAAAGRRGRVLPYDVTAGEPAVVDFRPAFAALADALGRGTPPALLAADFHATLADAVASVVRRLAAASGVRKVALSGGVFQNVTLLGQVVGLLEKDFTVLLHRRVPANDGGLALGQAAVAIERSR